MKTFASDLVGRLNPEDPHQNKEFSRDVGAVEQLIGCYHEGLLEHIGAVSRKNPNRLDALYSDGVPPSHIQLFHDLTVCDYVHEKYPVHTLAEWKLTYYETFLARLCERAADEGMLVLKSRMNQFANVYKGNKRMTIVGDIGILAGDMKTGALHIRGSVGNAGSDMKGGTLVVHGPVESIGPGMNGFIHVYHEKMPDLLTYESMTGTVFFNGKQAYP